MKKMSKDRLALQLLSYVVLILVSVIALYPFLALVISSFASEHDLIMNGYRLIHHSWSLDAYKTLFKNPTAILNSYVVTIFITVVGTSLSLFISTMTAYVLLRKEVKYRNKVAFFFYFTELFNGGLVSSYIIISKYLHLKNSYSVLILIPMFSVFNILILRNFIKGSVPYSLIESAKIDGANDWTIFTRMILPLSKPAIASIGLFTALGYWNDWYTAMLYVEKESMYPLQYKLYRMISTAASQQAASASAANIQMPTESLKLAMTVVAIGPIILVYPFVQKYFVAGITIGSVKE